MYQNETNVEKHARRDRSRCDDTRYGTKMTFYVPTVTPARPDNDSDHAKCEEVYAVAFFKVVQQQTLGSLKWDI